MPREDHKLNIEDVPIDETLIWESGKPVFFHLHINEFVGKEAEACRIWAVDVEPYSEADRHYFVVQQVIVDDVYLLTEGPRQHEPRAYLFGTGYVTKYNQTIYLMRAPKIENPNE